MDITNIYVTVAEYIYLLSSEDGVTARCSLDEGYVTFTAEPRLILYILYLLCTDLYSGCRDHV